MKGSFDGIDNGHLFGGADKDGDPISIDILFDNPSDSIIASTDDDEHNHWKRRDLFSRRYVYVWAYGIYLQARLEDEKQCILVLIGMTPEGRKELIGFTDGARESAQDWRELLLDLKRRGLTSAQQFAIADGGLDF